MGLEDLGKKASDLAGKAQDLAKDHADTVGEALKSDQAEQISDSVLDGAAKLANTVTGGKFSEQIGDVRDTLDGKIGNE